MAFEAIEHQMDENFLTELSSVASDVINHCNWLRQVNHNKYHYFCPDRVHMSDGQKENWILLFARQTDILPNSIPDSLVLDKILQTLICHEVPLLRAAWLLRILIHYEQRKLNHSLDDGISLFVGISNSIRGYLAQVTVSAHPKSGNARQNNEENNHHTLISRWNYCVELSMYLYFEGLLEQKHFVKWSLDIYRDSTFDQISFIVPLIMPLISDYSRSRHLLRIFIEATAVKLHKLKLSLGTSEVIHDQYISLIRLYQHTIVIVPELLMSPLTWSNNNSIYMDFLNTPISFFIPEKIRRSLYILLHRLHKIADNKNLKYFNSLRVAQPAKIYTKLLGTVYGEEAYNDFVDSTLSLPGNIEAKFKQSILYLLHWSTTDTSKVVNRVALACFILENFKSDNILSEGNETLLQAISEYLEQIKEHACGGTQLFRSVSYLCCELDTLQLFSLKRLECQLIACGLIDQLQPNRIPRAAKREYSECNEETVFLISRKILCNRRKYQF
ncbi:hypothetical protein BJ742DRAFT_83303 [Cladochytrium replicatum]|nr:hypothetical protein BJ742DRAFT_83303 [Cladochytrium replicatum]